MPCVFQSMYSTVNSIFHISVRINEGLLYYQGISEGTSEFHESPQWGYWSPGRDMNPRILSRPTCYRTMRQDRRFTPSPTTNTHIQSIINSLIYIECYALYCTSHSNITVLAILTDCTRNTHTQKIARSSVTCCINYVHVTS
jgi:hypothetical protein